MSKQFKLRTFSGVFTPSILTILGVIMYMRLPMIVGSTGLLGALGIILVAHIISATTGLSVSSIATDKKIEGGGTYYMISRSLGLPIGGTLGLALFVGLSFSISLYLIGFSESVLSYFEVALTKDNIRIAGTCILLLVTLITLISTTLAIKTQFIIMGLIVLSLISIFAGLRFHDFSPASPLISVPLTMKDYVIFLGIFFPAVTGFEAGVSMSGDLKNPKKSIPLGTIMAIVVGLVVYIILAFFLSYTVDRDMLLHPSVLQDISWKSELVIAGIWGATLSSALGSILAAPRILQAISIDKIIWKVFGKGVGKSNEPRNALIFTFFIAEAGILIGELNAIAEIVSIFFITTYGFLNLSCAFEAWTSADFRPSFRTPVWVSLVGAIACFVVMIQLNIIATIGAVVILSALFFYLKKKELTLQSGDAWSGVWASLVKIGLQRLKSNNLQTRNWRPNILMFNGGDKARPYMSQLGVALAGKLGILSSFELEKADDDLLVKTTRNAVAKEDSSRYFSHQHTCQDVYTGMDEIARVYGFSGVEPNTILMGWSRKDQHKERFLNLITNFQRSDYNSIFLCHHDQRKFGAHKTIDIWWSGWGKNLSLAANLIRHINTSSLWKEAHTRVLVINNNISQADRVYQDLARIIDHFRTPMEIKLINNAVDNLSRVDLILRESGATDLCIIGIPDRKYENINETDQEVSQLVSKLGTTLFINASSVFEEFDLGLDKEQESETTSYDQDFTLPIIRPSSYPAIANDIVKIETYGQEVLDRLYRRAFVPYFSSNEKFLKEFKTLSESILSSLKKLKEKNIYRRGESLFRIRRHFFADAVKILTRYHKVTIQEQMMDLENGIRWYFDRLDMDIARFPKKLEIQYPKKDFVIRKTDSRAIRWLKVEKKIFAPFAKNYISGKINYREVARYYLRDNRHLFFSALWEDFQRSSMQLQEKILALVSVIDEQFEKLERDSRQDTMNWTTMDQVVETHLQSIIDENTRLAKLFLGRFFVEFNRNIQLFSLDLEKININQLIKKKSAGKKWYEAIRLKNTMAPNRWHSLTVQATQKVKAALLIRSLRWQVHYDIHNFNVKFDRVVENKIVRAVDKVKEILNASPPDESAIKEIRKVEWSLEQDVLMKDFEELEEQLAEYIRKLPEELTIPDPRQDTEGVEEGGIVVPLSRISQHFIETKLLGPLHEGMELTLSRMKGIVFNINDQLSLAIFNIDNIAEEISDQTLEKILKKAQSEISKDENSLNRLKEDQRELSMKLIGDFMTPLSVYKLPKTTEEFSHLVRDYHSKRVVTKFGKIWRSVLSFLKKRILFVLYSRSEGILLAQRLAKSNIVKSVNERSLGLVNAVRPDEKVLQKLPHYYQNLFSGRSSIGENFWIPRSDEEGKWLRSVAHYDKGYYGGILVIGERNSGKTTLCRHFTDQMVKDRPSYHIFASQAGAIGLDEFSQEVSRVTGIVGSISTVLNALPEKTIIIIHDLELWWERSDRGMNLVNQLMTFIKDYSHKILFVVNMNPFAYQLINSLSDLQQSFIATIYCQPFSSIELKNLIITRHRSSGFEFAMGNRKEATITDVRMARLFNSFFNYSDGNPGVAMNAWLNGVQKISGKTLHIHAPMEPDIDILEHLPEDWNVLLVQLILHKRMSLSKIITVMNMEEEEIRKLLSTLLRSGLVKERTTELFVIDPYVESFLVKAFKEKDWL